MTKYKTGVKLTTSALVKWSQIVYYILSLRFKPSLKKFNKSLSVITFVAEPFTSKPGPDRLHNLQIYALLKIYQPTRNK